MAIGGRSLHVDVLQHHIDAGVRDNFARNPIVLAMDDASGGSWTAHRDGIALASFGKRLLEIALPAEVTAWLRRFDAGEECKPFSFRVEVSEERNRISEDSNYFCCCLCSPWYCWHCAGYHCDWFEPVCPIAGQRYENPDHVPEMVEIVGKP